MMDTTKIREALQEGPDFIYSRSYTEIHTWLKELCDEVDRLENRCQYLEFLFNGSQSQIQARQELIDKIMHHFDLRNATPPSDQASPAQTEDTQRNDRD